MSAARNLANRWLRHRTAPLSDAELSAPALVFSPHFDDETLGCGGTILRKRASGAPVALAFLTDGRASHRSWLAADELARLRADEGRQAAAALGVADDRVHFLGFEETQLARAAAGAVERVAALVDATAPEQVFVPCRREPPADHAATYAIVARALARRKRPTAVFEYPIWLWRQWPWTPPVRRGPRWGPRAWVREGRGLVRFLAGFDRRVEVGPQLPEKRAALARHRSQVERPEGQPDWPILGEIDGGAFVECFFQGFEVFAASASPGCGST